MTVGTEFESVLAAAQAGAEWAFSALYRDLNPALLRYLAAQAGSVGEDLAADTWLAAARQIGSFTGTEGAFRGWLFTIARRQLIQHWRTNGRRRTTPVADDTLAGRPASGAGADPEATALAAASARDIASAIAASLPPDQADVVLLRLVAGLDVGQVAAILGKRPGNVRALQHKAIKRLSGIFSEEALTP